MKRALVVVVLACLVVVAGGCAGRGRVTVPQEAGSYRTDWERAELYFGMAMPDGTSVTDAQFKKFLDESVTPVFPDGLTLIPTYGQWRGKDGKLVKEEGRLIIVIMPMDKGNQVKLDVVRKAYMREFKQESVLVSRQPAIATF